MTTETERPKRQLRQPTKGRLRDTLAKAADTIAEKNAEIDRLVTELDEADRSEKRIGLMGFWIGVAAALFASWAASMAVHS